MNTIPTLIETALGGMLQPIGQFMQRACAGTSQASQIHSLDAVTFLPGVSGVRAQEQALWTEAFFQWMENEGLAFPKGVNLSRVRDMALLSHKPEAHGALGWLAAEAIRLAADLKSEAGKDLEACSRAALLSPFCQVDLGMGDPPRRYQPLTKLVPDDALLPVERVDTGDYQHRYRQLWEEFSSEFKALCRLDDLDIFCEGLLSLSERYTSAIPLEAAALPDISLHDHSRTVAAIAACLYAWHARSGTLDDEAAIKDRRQNKFRFLAGDLSGIQHTLFLLANQQVKGVNRILRARSFVMAMLLEAAALRCRQALNLPVFNRIQNAGGRFLLLLPDLPEVPEKLAALRAEIDAWMTERYLGELALNLALSAPFAGNDLLPPNFHAVQESVRCCLEEAKLRSLGKQSTGILAADYPQGECTACGVRPAHHVEGDSQRCHACHDEHQIGGWLPKTIALSWRHGGAQRSERELDFFGGLRLRLYGEDEYREDLALFSAARLYRGAETLANGWPLRFIANYIPCLQEGAGNAPPYEDLSKETRSLGSGALKTFEHLTRDSLEPQRGGFIGKPWLAVLKADVDRLGFIVGFGLGDFADPAQDRATLSRYAALSRLLDLFFTGYSQQRLRNRFPNTYTVYAGGDDLLFIGPWWSMIRLAEDLNHQFRLYSGENPNITLSAGLALMQVNQPLNRAVREAEERLERAKAAGRNRVCLIGEQPVTWNRLTGLLQQAEKLNGWLRDDRRPVSTANLYRLLYFAEQRRRAEGMDGGMALPSANWRALWGHYLARNVRDRLSKESKELQEEIVKTFNQLLGLDERIQVQKTDEWQPSHTCIPVSIALYRNHS